MKKIHPFFTIGTVGIVITALLQIILTLYISGEKLQFLFLILYPVFILCMVIGFYKIIKEKKTV